MEHLVNQPGDPGFFSQHLRCLESSLLPGRVWPRLGGRRGVDCLIIGTAQDERLKDAIDSLEGY